MDIKREVLEELEEGITTITLSDRELLTLDDALYSAVPGSVNTTLGLYDPNHIADIIDMAKTLTKVTESLRKKSLIDRLRGASKAEDITIKN